MLLLRADLMGAAGAALVGALLLGLYLTLCFVVRSAVQGRRTGDSGFRGVSGRPPEVRWWAGVLFAVALLAGAAGVAGGLLGLSEVPGAGTGPSRAAGLGVAGAGVAATLLAQSAMGRSWRVGVDEDERTELVTGGVFALVRNPVFSAMAVVAAGLALAVPNVLSLGSAALLLVAIHLQVRAVEEPYLASMHGQVYEDYVTRTGRYLPRPARTRSTAERG